MSSPTWRQCVIKQSCELSKIRFLSPPFQETYTHPYQLRLLDQASASRNTKPLAVFCYYLSKKFKKTWNLQHRAIDWRKPYIIRKWRRRRHIRKSILFEKEEEEEDTSRKAKSQEIQCKCSWSLNRGHNLHRLWFGSYILLCRWRTRMENFWHWR